MEFDQSDEAQLDWIKRYLSKHKNTIEKFFFRVGHVTLDLRNALKDLD